MRERDELEAQCVEEIADALARRRHLVSSKAAAHYLGIHISTLSKLRSAGIGPKGSVGNILGAVNAKVRYTLVELDAWKDERTSRGYIEQRKMTELSRARSERDTLALSIELAEAKREISRLKKKLANRTAQS